MKRIYFIGLLWLIALPVWAQFQIFPTASQLGGSGISTLNGSGTNTTFNGQTNIDLTASKIILTGTGKKLISSAYGETDLVAAAALGGNVSNYVNSVGQNVTNNFTNYVAATPLQITYVGKFFPSIFFAFAPGMGRIPEQVVGSGQSLVYPSSGAHLSILSYTEQINGLGSTGGTITNLVFDNLVGMAGVTLIANQVTNVGFPVLQYISGNFSPNLGSAATFDAPKLEYAGGTFSVVAPLISFYFPSLTNIMGQLNPFGSSATTNLNFPVLTQVNTFTPTTMSSLLSMDFPLLKAVTLTTFNPSSMAALTNWNFPVLAYIAGNFSPSSMASMTYIDLPSMVIYGGTITIPSATMANIATLSLGTVGTLKQIAGATITLSGLKLNTASVNGILALLVSLDGTGGTTTWGSGKTVNISGGTSAAPSGQGIVDKSTLITRGATVTTN